MDSITLEGHMCYITLLSWKTNTYPPHHNANNIEQYSTYQVLSGKFDPRGVPTPLLEWPLTL